LYNARGNAHRTDTAENREVLYRRGGLTVASVNKVHHVHTIARVAAMLGA
jgi:hypothetical protein